MTTRRTALVHVNPDDLAAALGIPGTIRNARHDHERGAIVLLVANDALPEVPEACEPPRIAIADLPRQDPTP